MSNEAENIQTETKQGGLIDPVVKTACSCGQEMLIEHGAERTWRADGKRVFYSHDDDSGLCAFRCRNCRMQVSETVPGADYEVTAAF